MKVWELEEGKEYVSRNEMRFKVSGDVLKYYDECYPSWCLSHLEYNEVAELDFTIYTPPTDWSKVKVDTKVLVRDYDDEVWTRRHFAKYENGTIYVYSVGTTSFTTDMFLSSYNQAKLYTE